MKEMDIVVVAGYLMKQINDDYEFEKTPIKSFAFGNNMKCKLRYNTKSCSMILDCGSMKTIIPIDHLDQKNEVIKIDTIYYRYRKRI